MPAPRVVGTALHPRSQANILGPGRSFGPARPPRSAPTGATDYLSLRLVPASAARGPPWRLAQHQLSRAPVPGLLARSASSRSSANALTLARLGGRVGADDGVAVELDELGNYTERSALFSSPRLRKSRTIRPTSGASTTPRCVRSVHPDDARTYKAVRFPSGRPMKVKGLRQFFWGCRWSRVGGGGRQNGSCGLGFGGTWSGWGGDGRYLRSGHLRRGLPASLFGVRLLVGAGD